MLLVFGSLPEVGRWLVAAVGVITWAAVFLLRLGCLKLDRVFFVVLGCPDKSILAVAAFQLVVVAIGWLTPLLLGVKELPRLVE